MNNFQFSGMWGLEPVLSPGLSTKYSEYLSCSTRTKFFFFFLLTSTPKANVFGEIRPTSFKCLFGSFAISTQLHSTPSTIAHLECCCDHVPNLLKVSLKVYTDSNMTHFGRITKYLSNKLLIKLSQFSTTYELAEFLCFHHYRSASENHGFLTTT